MNQTGMKRSCEELTSPNTSTHLSDKINATFRIQDSGETNIPLWAKNTYVNKNL